MDRTLTLMFTDSLTTQDIITKISDFYKILKNEFSPNLEGMAQKMGPTPIRSFRGFWQEIHIF